MGGICDLFGRGAYLWQMKSDFRDRSPLIPAT
jgi:hypothetical protein